MDLPRFSDTPFSLEAFEQFARDIPQRTSLQRFLTVPHPSYVVHTFSGVPEGLPLHAKHVGWQSLLIEETEPVALLEAATDAMGRLFNVATIMGDLPAGIIAALARAEKENLLTRTDFAVVAVPQIAYTGVWIPSEQMVISVGPDVHRTMPKGMPRNEESLRRLAPSRMSLSPET
jgi:hypothetical protein